LILCSDGLSNKLSADEIREVAQREENQATACGRLIELANERGGEDNITVIVARFDGEELHSAADSNSITGSFKVLDHGCLSGDFLTLSEKFKALAIRQDDQSGGCTTFVLSRLEAEARSAQEPEQVAHSNRLSNQIPSSQVSTASRSQDSTTSRRRAEA